jgi:hypothetical protein
MRLVDGKVRLSASDVANFLACRHLTRLDLLSAPGVISPPPHLYDAGFEDLVKRGEEHEKGVLRDYRDRGLQVVEIAKDTSSPAAGAAAPATAASGRQHHERQPQRASPTGSACPANPAMRRAAHLRSPETPRIRDAWAHR